MAYIDGTRTSTLTMSHTQNVNARIYNPSATTPTEQTWQTNFTNFTFGGHLGFLGSLAINQYRYQTTPNGPWSWEVGATITVNNGHGSSNTGFIVLASGSEASGTTFVDVSVTCAGTFSASVSTDKLWNFTEAAFSSSSAPTQFPSLTSVTWYEMTTTGATAACSLTAGGGSVAVSAAASSRQTANYTATLSATGNYTGPGTHNFAISLVKVNTVAVHDITHAHTFHDQSATEWTLSLKGAVDAFGDYVGAG